MDKEHAVVEYSSIIDYYRGNPPEVDVYCEDHHIVPRACGGPDTMENIVALPFPAHFRCHEILPYIYDTGKEHEAMVFAWNQMRTRRNGIVVDAEIAAVLREEHAKMQSEVSKNLWEDPEYRKMQSEKAKNQWKDPEYRKMQSEKMSEVAKNLWEDPEYWKMMSEKMSEVSKNLWEDSEYRKMMSEKMSEVAKNLWEDPEYRKMESEKAKNQWKDPEYRKMQSEKAKNQWKDPEYRKMQSEKAKNQWKDPQKRAQILAKRAETNARRKAEKADLAKLC